METINRRELFKRISKTLPLLVLPIVVSSPIGSFAMNVNDCNGNCEAFCKSSCIAQCARECMNTCEAGCSDSCARQCRHTCNGQCVNTCRWMCDSGCTGCTHVAK